MVQGADGGIAEFGFGLGLLGPGGQEDGGHDGGDERHAGRDQDIGAQANQFAMAKALASGDPRLMQKAGLEAEIARLRRLRAAHFDGQHAARRMVADAQAEAWSSRTRCGQIEADLQQRLPTRGDLFSMEVNGKPTTERRVAGGSLLTRIRLLAHERAVGKWTLARIGGFDVKAEGRSWGTVACHRLDVWLDRTGHEQAVEIEDELTPMGLVTRLEYMLDRMEVDLAGHRRRIVEAEAREASYGQRIGEAFAYEAELDAKQAELDAIEADLGANAARLADSADAARFAAAA